jgi:hypothetical protein
LSSVKKRIFESNFNLVKGSKDQTLFRSWNFFLKQKSRSPAVSVASQILSLYCDSCVHLRRPLHVIVDKFTNNEGTYQWHFKRNKRLSLVIFVCFFCLFGWLVGGKHHQSMPDRSGHQLISWGIHRKIGSFAFTSASGIRPYAPTSYQVCLQLFHPSSCQAHNPPVHV